MLIMISERLKPFSHLPGTQMVLPGTSLQFEIYPALVKISDLSRPNSGPISLIPKIAGPVKEFTVMLDLEKGFIKVWGHSAKGYFRYRICSKGSDWALMMEKTPNGGLEWDSSTGTVPHIEYIPPLTDRLSLGNHKSQDWDLVVRRQDLTEILPIWLRLGQLVPLSDPAPYPQQGTLQLLKKCIDLIEEKNRVEVYGSLLNLFNAGFRGILSPRLEDDHYQGFHLSRVEAEGINPLILLTEGARLIRSLFIQHQENQVDILPAIPPDFHCGRLIQETIGDAAIIDMEWTKKTIRRMNLKVLQSKNLHISFPKNIKRLRVRKGEKDRGKVEFAPLTLAMEQGNTYLLDNFEK